MKVLNTLATMDNYFLDVLEKGTFQVTYYERIIVRTVSFKKAHEKFLEISKEINIEITYL